MNSLIDTIKDIEKSWKLPRVDIYSGKIKQCLENQKNYLESLDTSNYFIQPPTKDITGLELEKYITTKEFKVFNHNGRQYMIGCAICVNEGNDTYGGGDVRFGFATVHPKDVFDEKIGQEIAYKRALGLDKTESGKKKTTTFNREIYYWKNKFEMAHSTSPKICRPDGMFELIKLSMPTITANKFVEYVTETDKDSIKYIRK